MTSVVAGLPVAMFSLATLVIMALRQYSFAQMGDVLAAGLIARAVLLPLLAAIGNRYGPRRVLIPQVLIFCAATIALMQDAEFHKPISMLYLAGAFAGATVPTVGAPVRTAWAAMSRWSTAGAQSTEVIDDPERRSVALEWSAIGDIAVLGPLFTMLLVASGHPRGGLIGVCGFAFFGVMGPVLQPSLDRAERPGRDSIAAAANARWGQARRPAAVIVLALIALLTAAAIAAIEISTVAAADRDGHHALSGLFLAIGAVGCFAGGLWKGWQKIPAHRALIVALVLVVIATALLWLGPNVRVLPVGLFLLGVFLRPVLTSGFSILVSLVGPGRLTGALPWYGMCVCLGAAAGVAAAGGSIGLDGASGPADGYLTAAAFAAAAALVCLAALSSLGKPGRHAHTAGRGGAVPATSSAVGVPGAESGELPFTVGR